MSCLGFGPLQAGGNATNVGGLLCGLERGGNCSERTREKAIGQVLGNAESLKTRFGRETAFFAAEGRGRKMEGETRDEIRMFSDAVARNNGGEGAKQATVCWRSHFHLRLLRHKSQSLCPEQRAADGNGLSQWFSTVLSSIYSPNLACCLTIRDMFSQPGRIILFPVPPYPNLLPTRPIETHVG